MRNLVKKIKIHDRALPDFWRIALMRHDDIEKMSNNELTFCSYCMRMC